MSKRLKIVTDLFLAGITTATILGSLGLWVSDYNLSAKLVSQGFIVFFSLMLMGAAIEGGEK